MNETGPFGRQAASHLSELSLARLLLGKATPEEVGGIEAHAEGCARCRAELDLARRAQQRFTEGVFPRTLPALQERLTPRPFWRRLFPTLGLATVLATAAVVAVLVLPKDDPLLQTKGAAAFQIFAFRGDHVFPVVDRARLHPGDRIRFGVSPGSARFVLVASIDGRGQVNVYQPSTPLAPGPGPVQFLEGSIALDDTLGPERIFALFSDRPVDGALVTRALAKLAGSGEEAIRRTDRLPLPFAQTSILIEKVAAPEK